MHGAIRSAPGRAGRVGTAFHRGDPGLSPDLDVEADEVADFVRRKQFGIKWLAPHRGGVGNVEVGRKALPFDDGNRAPTIVAKMPVVAKYCSDQAPTAKPRRRATGLASRCPRGRRQCRRRPGIRQACRRPCLPQVARRAPRGRAARAIPEARVRLPTGSPFWTTRQNAAGHRVVRPRTRVGLADRTVNPESRQAESGHSTGERECGTTASRIRQRCANGYPMVFAQLGFTSL